MMNNGFLKKICIEGRGFLDAVSKADERAYLILLSVYITLFYLLKFGWAKGMGRAEGYIRYTLIGIVIWGSALYLFFVIASWKKLWKNNVALIFTGAVILSGVLFFTKKMSTNSYGVVMDIYFCVMACGKDYRKMLRCILCVAVVMLIIAGLGLPLGYTWDMVKPENAHPGHSLGINYPNTWGYLVFLAMMIFWYLYLRFKPLFTCVFFWGISVFMYFYICCRTISLLGFAFPVLAFLTDLLEKTVKRRAEKQAENTEETEQKEQTKQTKQGTLSPWKAAEGIITLMPFIAFAFVMFVSYSYEWVHRHFYHRKLHNLAMRFVQGGLYFKTYGLPLVGNPYRSNQYTYVNVNGEFEKVGILDSSFASYIIMRGLLWILYTLAWLCLAIRRALKNRDYAIPFLEFIILVFAMMERPGLEMWYNFVLLYPLAKAAQTAGTAQTAAQEDDPDQMEEENAAGNEPENETCSPERTE